MRLSIKVATVIALVFLMASATLMSLPVQAQAQVVTPSQWGPLPPGVTPGVTVITYPFLSVTPNPVGVGQTVLVNIWTTPPADVTVYASNYKVTITNPSGTVDTRTVNSYYGDRTAWFEYVVDEVGTWQFQMQYPGDYYPAGTYQNPSTAANSTFTISRWYKPSTTPVTKLVVQQEFVFSWPPSPLPTDYWTRPVESQNREWWPILGNYPWSGDGSAFASIWPEGTNYFKGNTKYNAWVTAPGSAHILWERQDAISGLVGSELGTVSLYASGDVPTLIYSGRCYDTMTVPINGVPTSCAVCYDLRTGEMYYEIPTAAPYNGVTPTSIVYYRDTTLGSTTGQAVPGTEAREEASVELLVIGSRLLKIDPWTGAVATNVTGMSGTQIGQYVISMQTNNTAIGNRLINWTLVGNSANFASRVVENRSVAFSSIPVNTDWQAGVFGTISSIAPATAATIGCRIIGYSLKTGQITCNFTDDQVPYTTSASCVDHGKIACLMVNGYVAAYDLLQGKRAWISQQTYEVGGYPWGTWGDYDAASYGGNFIQSLYDGVYAFNWTTGKISWVYRDPAVPFESPYNGYNPFYGGVTIADGKIFALECEHSISQPINRGWGLHCINATTGEGIWHIKGTKTGTGGATVTSYTAMADGYLTFGSSDGYMYVIGRGKSATTVTAPDVVIPQGNGIIIKGTVLDLSPAQPGTPCVVKESMTQQMEYLHMQMPIGGVWENETITGVPVTLTAIDSNGTVYDLGTATTNGYSGAFSLTWTPPTEGTYDIIASFKGDESYGSSMSTTSLAVGPPTPAVQFPEQVQPIDYSGTITNAAIAIIIAVALVGLALFIALRKR